MNDRGLPVGLWIRLTVCGVTRLGYGSCPAGQIDSQKVLVGDAIRNAAMSFGVALDLWIRGQAEDDEHVTHGVVVPDVLPAAEPTPAQVLAHTIRHELDAGQRDALKAWCARENIPAVVAKMSGRQQERVAKLIVSGDLDRLAVDATTTVAAPQETTRAPETAA
ncbi:MAG: hypothetical protein IPM45_18175 [Acidimicrobiales bacterium]|nr:hypothetical protein [Acidimicrobiales bacterium]